MVVEHGSSALAARPIRHLVDYVHRCEFCGWTREAESAAISAPLCASCGCGLTSLRRTELPPPEVSDLERLDGALRLNPAFVQAARVVLAVAVVLAAARAGYLEGGVPIAVAAFGASGLFAVPLAVPGRLGSG